MRRAPLPLCSSSREYEDQADAALAAWNAGEAEAIRLFRHCHPRFLDDRIRWLPRKMSDAEAKSIALDRDDARLAVVRGYSFPDWPRLVEWAKAVALADSPVCRFEAAVEAVIAGDVAELEMLLREDETLVRARATMVTCFDPPVHGAALLHYLSANGVENYRQKSPPNAAAVARALREAGAEPNALAAAWKG